MDWNNDGKKDLIAGDARGNVTLFLNIGTEKEPKLAKGKQVEADGKPITEGSHELAESRSWLHMADWDGDNLKDLLVGHEHTLILYKNVGTQSAPRFQSPILIKRFEGVASKVKIKGRDAIIKVSFRPSPYVIDWDGDGRKDLLVGCEKPMIHFYRNMGTNQKPQLAKGEVLDLKCPRSVPNKRWRIEVTDWNNDGKKDLVLGNLCAREDYVPRPGTVAVGGNIWLFLGE